MSLEVQHTACPLDCPDICDLKVEVDQTSGKLLRVNGGERSPITAGFICGKVRNIDRYLYSDERVLYPMVRVAPKHPDAGSSHPPRKRALAAEFRRASWEEALSLVAGRLREIRDRAGGEAIFPYHYGGSNGWISEGGTAERFFRRLGASRCLRTLCACATTAATRGLYGHLPGVPLEDYEHSRLIVLWGVNPSATGIHLVPIIERARERGAKLVVVDPRSTPLARKADLHLALRPGTDLPVALAVIAALFERGLAAKEFLAAHTVGAEELEKRAREWTVARAANEGGIPEATLERFIELYAHSEPAAVRAGWGLERNRNGGSAVAAVLALPAVAGKFGVRGGGYTLSNGDARFGINAEPGIAEPPSTTRGLNMSQLASVLNETENPRIEALFVYNANPVATTPNQNGVRHALARNDLFVVVHEQTVTETALLADVILPATTFLEHREVRRGYGTMRLYDSKAVLAPIGEARSNTELFFELSQRLSLTRPGDPNTDQEISDAIFQATPEGAVLRQQLEQAGVAEPLSGAHPIAFMDVFPTTPDEKIHLVPEALDREANGLYNYRADPKSERFPLALISPAIAQQISSTFGNLRKGCVALEMHPHDATLRGIKAGDTVRVWNELGEVWVDVRLSTEVRTGVVVLPKGLWGHHTKNGNTANALIGESLADLGGQATYNDARVEVERLQTSI
ncbi:MAG: molybdopterin-dependent oxidoreductase [Polyangiaceae bacterium]|nr:molybdopterin-dependent oxidoreductase [Polyangiaceae bacterium]